MANIMYLDEIPKEYTLQSIKKSSNQTLNNCFLIDDGKNVFKLLEGMGQYEKEFTFLANQKSKVFSFPETIVMIKTGSTWTFTGYITSFVEGQTLMQVNESERNIVVNDFVSALGEVEIAIARDISINGVLLNDLNMGNVLYTPDRKIKVIDTDLYDESHLEARELHNLNLREYNNNISVFINKAFDNKGLYPGFIKAIQTDCVYGDLKAKDYLRQLKSFLENQTQKEIVTFSDLDKAVERVRK